MRNAPATVRAGRGALLVLGALLVSAGCGRPGGDPGTGEVSRPGAVAGTPAGGPAVAAPLEAGLRLLREGDLVGAEARLLEALKTAPRDRRALQALGAVYARSDRPRQAERSLRRAIEVDPEAIGARLGLAEVLVDTGRPGEALAELDQALRRAPREIRALVARARALHRLGRVDDAEAAARVVLNLQEGNVDGRYLLGLCLERREDLDGAEAALRRVLDLAPAHLGALSRLAVIETRRGRPADAARYREAHHAALASRRVEDRVRDQRRLGVAAFNREDYGAALRAFEAIAREDPSDPQVYLYIGSTLVATGRLEEARAALERSLRLEPRNERALMELGRVHALANRLDDAVASLSRAIEINPEFAEPHYFLAGVHMARGRADLYRAELERFEELRARSSGAVMEISGGPDGERR